MSLRLLKVNVQAVYVEDDGHTLTERVTQPVAVPAAEWPDFPAALERRRCELEAAESDTPKGTDD